MVSSQPVERIAQPLDPIVVPLLEQSGFGRREALDRRAEGFQPGPDPIEETWGPVDGPSAV